MYGGAATTKHGRRDDLAKGRKQQSLVESTHKLCLGDLDDNLLLEVLLRLPTAKHALICSSVCKKWYRLILNDFFIGRFVSYHMDHDVNYNCDIVIHDPDTSHLALRVWENHKFQIENLDLRSFCEGSTWASILSSCHDLVLCVADMEEEGFTPFRYFICNFLTMQKTALPVPAEWLEEYPFSDDINCAFAFICKPYCARDTQGRCTPSPGYRYRVLRFRGDKQSHIFGLPVEMYCSETPHRWDTVYLLHEGAHGEVCSNLFAYKEKVHWFNGTNIVAYDPFNTVGSYGDTSERFCDTSEGFCIPHPDIEQRMSAFLFRVLGICQGRLRFMELGNLYGEELTADPEAAWLRVWDLKDYENKKWSMERRVCLYTLASQSGSVFKIFPNWNDLTMRMLAPHPFNEDVIFLSFNDKTFACNMRTEELKLLDEFGAGDFTDYNEHETSAKLITIPWWPTPITPILQNSQQ